MTRPCAMLFRAVVSCASLSRRRRSANAPARLMPSTATAALAIASASAVGESENASMTRVGSGTISTAPIAVKWWETIASVSSRAAIRGRTYLVAANRACEGRCPENHAEHDGCHDERQLPSDVSGDLDGPHAGVVHDADASSDYDAANQHSPKPRYCQRDRKADARHNRGDHQRQQGQADIVGNRNARLVGEHGHEMRRPDAAAGGDAGGREPGQPGAAAGGAGAMEQAAGRE